MRPMKREPVESSTIQSMGYESGSETLEIEFTSGIVYQYLDVPAQIFQRLQAAASKGSYFNHEIRDSYECVRLGKSRRAGA
jgi:hypothetical protein